MKNNQNYPSIYRWAYAAGKEMELLDSEQRRQIPKQIIYNWRNTTLQARVQIEEELGIKSQLDSLIEKEDLDWFRKRRMMLEISKLHFGIISMYGAEKYHQLLSSNKKEFVNLIERYSANLPLELQRPEPWSVLKFSFILV